MEMKTAVIQISAGPQKGENIAKAIAFVKEAIANGAQWILLPEMFNYRGDTRTPQKVKEAAEKIPGPSLKPLMSLAKTHRVYIQAGSLIEQNANGHAHNTSVTLGPLGVIAKYRKIHLFQAHLTDTIMNETRCFQAGKGLCTVKVEQWVEGGSVCYDIRFPKLYQDYARKGVNVIVAPSCFTQKTGQAHWEVLLRARAIENLSYVLAPNQVGQDFRGVQPYGHSMTVSPWGEIIAQASGNKEEIIYATLDLKEVAQARSKLPGIIKV